MSRSTIQLQTWVTNMNHFDFLSNFSLYFPTFQNVYIIRENYFKPENRELNTVQIIFQIRRNQLASFLNY